MAKLFLKTTYSIFLWLLLLVNILFFFNLPSLLGQYVMVKDGNFSDKYFGVSTLINALKNLDSMPISNFTQDVGSIMNKTWAYASSLMGHSLPNYSEANNFWDYIVTTLSALKNIGKYLWSMLCYIAAFGLGFLYFCSMVLNLFFTILMFMSGYYYNDVPQSLIFSQENNMLLNIPLVYRFCCC